ncbi:protein kinase domain-containing protein [Citrus sinensis]|nr:protein kinase domain-containing protein [Citrus sinensis]
MTRINFGVIYRHKPRNTNGFCWKLHGRPKHLGKDNKSSGQNSKGFQAATDNANANSWNQGSNLFTKDQLKQLVSKLTKDFNCMAKFSPSNCEFQDLCTGKKIGSAKEDDGLYYLEEEPEALICSPQNLPPSNNNQQEEQDCSSPQKQSNPSDDQQVPSQIQPSTTQNLEDAQKPKAYSQQNKTIFTSPDCQNSESNIELLEDTGIVQSESKLHLNSLPSFHLDLDLPIAHIKSVGTCTKHPISKFVSYHRLSPSFKAFATNQSSVTTPRTVQDALANPKWREAICEELRALYKNRTCALADLPSGKKTVGCKWVFMVKHKADGSIERFKVGLVAKEYTQTYGIDYRKTFAPVAKINSFQKRRDEIERLKRLLTKEFETKDLGSLKYFLRIEVARSRKGIFLSQRKYILDLLKETGMLGCKPSDVPIESNHRLGVSTKSSLVNKEQYQSLVGKLIYLCHTCPDITFAVRVVSQFMHSPNVEHVEAVFRILKYLMASPGKGNLFSKNNHLRFEAYTDADWTGSFVDRKSISGYCTFVGGNLVTWRSKEQSVVPRSSAEAEFRAMALGICELMQLTMFLMS